ncbi:hypothetical protein QN277_028766 [Acacia crassicarpa]|uniref:Uncharacterized protein n=1 Tax=Acacia crassicarpa TaxID=499986 RepID=A0AAE1J6D4_9FABA|nr:hypothetical protein QN277_028766 [Acacia crassicarpa]
MGSNKEDLIISQRLQALIWHCWSHEPSSFNNSSSSQFRPTKRASVLICLFRGDDGESKSKAKVRMSVNYGGMEENQGMLANRVALYDGILRDRMAQLLAYSY